jgi:DNA-binding CsgD family transcriptional regulator
VHRGNVMRKMRVFSVAELAHIAGQLQRNPTARPTATS